jgi:uncharacterized protein (TIGR03435 family)
MLVTALGFLIFLSPFFSQAANTSRPSFEVASIKPYVPPAPGQPQMRGIRQAPGGRLDVAGMTLKTMMTFAYRIRDFQIVGGPDWMNADLWEVTAKAEAGAVPLRTGPPDPNVPDPLSLMLQSLIDERFQLKMHRETRDLPTYELVIAKGGPKFELSADQSFPAPPDPKNPAPPPPPPPVPRGTPGRHGMTMMRNPTGFTLQGNAVPLANLINALSQQLGRTVIDKTDLKPGLYDFKLEWTADPVQSADSALLPPPAPNGAAAGGASPPSNDPQGPSIFSAIQDQLGLRLVSSKGQVEVFIIDSATKPAE